MKKVTLQILAKDIWENSYTDCSNCPITKALHRAGYTDLHEGGSVIDRITNGVLKIVAYTPDGLLDKLFQMYGYKEQRELKHEFTIQATAHRWGLNHNRPALEPADFTWEIELPD